MAGTRISDGAVGAVLATDIVPVGTGSGKTTRLMSAIKTFVSLDQVVVSTAGGTITLDMNSQSSRMFNGSASIGAPKTWALSNASIAIFIPSAKFVMTTLDLQTFPASFKMATFEANWNPATKVWTPPDVGTYEMSATFDGTNWLMKIQGPY